MTWYLRIKPLFEPCDLGLDEGGRPQCGFDIITERRTSVTFEEELLKILVTAGVGVFGTNIFTSTNATLPTDGTFLTIRHDRGLKPRMTHNEAGIPGYPRSGARISAHSRDGYEAARTMARAAYAALAVIRNVEIVP